MKAILILLLCPLSLCAMNDEKTLSESAEEQAALQLAGELKVNQGPEKGWHKANSLIQAIISPAGVSFSQEGITFPHYKRAYLTYTEEYKDIQEWLNSMCSADCEEVEKEAIHIINPMDPLKRLSESEKYRIARAWLYNFLNDNYFNADQVKEYAKKGYLEALKKGDHKALAHLSSIIAEQNDSLNGRIFQHRIKLLMNGIQ